MICANMIAFGRSAKSSVPYSARLEYIESTGTQYIDTRLSFNSNTDTLKLDYQNTSSTTHKWLFGTYESNAQIGISSGSITVPTFWYKGSVSATNNDQFLTRHTYYLDINGLSNDGILLKEFASFIGTWNVFLFALNNSNGLVNGYYGIGRIYEYRQTRNGVLIQSLIPVLDKAGVACMYDEVSGEFFYNQGTGEFVAGPIVERIFYIARDYIQDGLVAMWDGKENAGWGTHDASGTCQNLVGEGVFTGTASDDSFTLSKSCKVDNIDTSSNMTIEWLYPVSGADRNVRFATQLIGQNVDRYQVSDVRVGYAIYQIRYWKNGAQESVYPMFKTVRRGGISFGSGMFKVYADGVEIVSYEADAATDSNALFVAEPFNFNNLRVYSRALTAEEIAHNYSIDKARFNLP